MSTARDQTGRGPILLCALTSSVSGAMPSRDFPRSVSIRSCPIREHDATFAP